MLAAGAAIAALALGAGCGTAEAPPAAPQPAVDPTPTPTPDQSLGEGSGDGQGSGSDQGSGGSGGSGGGGGNQTTKPPSGGGWPSPEDCISYNPANLTVNFDPNGIYNLLSGSTLVLRVYGEQGDNTGDKVLALAKRYRKHCYIGRSNTRVEERGNYIFDYWRDSSGQKPTIPDQEEDCSSYDPTNLRADDMGSGYGWRVRDDDHVLHVFDNESDAKKGKQVLAKYHQICFIGDPGDLGRDVIGYML
jgi:hypothetical protein